VNTAAIVSVTETTIRHNSSAGMMIQNGARAFVTGATISGNAAYGIYVQGAAIDTTAEIADSTIEQGLSGVHAMAATGTTARVSVSDSRVFGASNGLVADSTAGGAVTLSAGNNRVSNNGTGIGASGAGAKIWASGNVVSNNLGYGLWNNGNGSIFESAGDNAVRNNASANSSGVITVLPTM
jgi:hypothetical protein